MGMTKFEFFAIVVFVMAVLGLAAWREIKNKRDEANARKDRYEEKSRKVAQARRNEEEDARLAKLYAADHYNEACSMEPFCGGSDAHTRSRAAVARAQEAVRSSMKAGNP